MKDFHGAYDCKTEKKTLPIPPIGFSMRASRYRDVINLWPICARTHMETNDKRILNRLRNWNRIPFRSLLETSHIVYDVQLDKEFRYKNIYSSLQVSLRA
jgi:hypothetical protein